MLIVDKPFSMDYFEDMSKRIKSLLSSPVDIIIFLGALVNLIVISGIVALYLYGR